MLKSQIARLMETHIIESQKYQNQKLDLKYGFYTNSVDLILHENQIYAHIQ